MNSSKKINVVVAVDSFKGTLTSLQISAIIKNSVSKVIPEAEISSIPIADGGEGTVEAFVENLGGEYIEAEVHDPFHRIIKSRYGIIDNGKTAVIEMAAASGLNLLAVNEKNPLHTSTYGTGELIIDAINKNVEHIIIGIGGSATNDGGIGMASALGIKFLNKNNDTAGINGLSLKKIKSIDFSDKLERLKEIKISVLSDVTNPLLGYNGASRVYGPQKGGNNDQIEKLEEGLKNLVEVVKKQMHLEYENVPGAGAAGGLGYGLLTFLDAELHIGINTIIDRLKIEEKIQIADFVITGEGKMDIQTTFNKAPWGIMKLAKKYNKPVVGICAVLEEDRNNDLSKNFDYIFSIVNDEISREESLSKPDYYLFELSKKVAMEIMKKD